MRPETALFWYVFQVLFWVSLGTILYTYLGFPLFIYLRSELRPRPWLQLSITPSVSVIVAVHNGATLLRQKIENLLTVEYPPEKLDIIVVSDGSSDGTNQILRSYDHPRLRSMICDDQRGKVAALNEGIKKAKGEILLFVDIRPRLDTRSVKLLISNFADPQVGCVAGNLEAKTDGSDVRMRAVTDLYWKFEQWMRRCEAQIDSSVGVYGGFYAVRRELVKLLPDGTILDDLLQSLNVIRQGYRCVSDERANVYDNWPNRSQDEFSRKVRTLAGNFQVLRIAPWVLSRQNRVRVALASHKLLRLIVPPMLVICLITTGILSRWSMFYETVFISQLLFYFLGAFHLARKIPVLKSISGAAGAFCMLNVAVVVAFYKFLFVRGPLWRIWIPTPIISPADIDEG